MNSYIYALGFFDGVHLGHQALLDAVKKLALPGARGVVTFLDHPDTLVLGETPGLINTPQDRELLLKHYGMDKIVALPFDKKTQTTPWRDFLEDLREHHGAAGFVCGEDFRFGARGAGNAQLLAEYCREAGLPYAIVPEWCSRRPRIWGWPDPGETPGWQWGSLRSFPAGGREPPCR